MQLDDMKAAWAAHGALLERSLAVDERLLREVLLRKVRFAVAPLVFWRMVEVAIGAAALSAVVSVLARHAHEPRYLIAGGALAVFGVVLLAMTVRILAGVLRIDSGGPVAETQRRIERVKVLEYRAFKWALLGGVVVWLPGLLVLFEAATGVAALARVDLAWLAMNLIVGLVVYFAGEAWSRRYVERADATPWARRFAEGVSGRGLRTASAHLNELASFVREERV